AFGVAGGIRSGVPPKGYGSPSIDRGRVDTKSHPWHGSTTIANPVQARQGYRPPLYPWVGNHRLDCWSLAFSSVWFYAFILIHFWHFYFFPQCYYGPPDRSLDTSRDILRPQETGRL